MGNCGGATEPGMTSTTLGAGGAEVSGGRAGALARVKQFRREAYERGGLPGRNGGHYSIRPAGVDEPAGDWLAKTVRAERARRTLDVGLGLAMSTLAIVEGVLESSGGDPSGGGVLHVTIDPAQGWCEGAGVRAVEDAGIGALTRVVEHPSAVVLPALVQSGAKFDFAFVDGSHLFDHKFLDVFYALRLVRSGGLVLMDDHHLPATQMVLAFFTTNLGLKLEKPAQSGPEGRFVGFRVPERELERAWDHFVDFSRANVGAGLWWQGSEWERPATGRTTNL